MTTTTTVRSIEATIREVLTANGHEAYLQFATPVISALVEREQAISELLVEKATGSTDYDESEARHFLREIGMAVAEPDDDEDDDEKDNDEPDTIEDRITNTLDRIERRLDGLTDFARRNGYRG